MATHKKPARRKASSVPITAPVPPPRDGRPSLAEAKGLAKDSARRHASQSASPGAVSNQEDGLAYYYWDALELAEDRQVKLRVLLGQKGYWKSEGSEYVAGVPHAEIWATYDEVKRELDKATARRHNKLKQQVSGLKS